MAKMIPIKYDQSAMKTEKRLFDIFRKGLSSKHYCLSELYLQNSRADFVIVGPETGVIVFEVKDWLFSTIRYKKNDQFILQKEGTTDRFVADDPFDQFQKYKRDIFQKFMNHNIRLQKEIKGKSGQNHKFGVREGLVLGGITKEEFYHGITGDGKPLAGCFNRRNIIFKDDLEAIENGSKDLLTVIKEALFISYIGDIELSTDWVKKIKGAFYQDRIIRNSLDGDIDFIQMDDEQGIASNVLPNSNLLIRGSAGSGKTIVLMKRALILLSELEDETGKILYTYHNRAIGNKIQSDFNDIEMAFNDGQLREQVEFIHIDALMSKLKYSLSVEKYNYILVDEAQDIKREDLFNLNKLLKNKNEDNFDGKITLCSDGGQNIYSRESFSYSDLELNLEVLELKTVYRCTAQIHQIAIEPLFDSKYNANLTHETMMVDYSVQHNDYLRNGKPVNFIELGEEGLNSCVRDEIFKLYDSGVMPHEIAVVCLYNNTIDELIHNVSELTFCKLDENYSLDSESDDVCIATINSIKGYEFRNIILCNFESKSFVTKEQFPRKFYVALTRSMVECTVIVSSKDHDLVHELSKKNDTMPVTELDETIDLEQINEGLSNTIDQMREAYLIIEAERDNAVKENDKLLISNRELSKKQMPLNKKGMRFKNIAIVSIIVLLIVAFVTKNDFFNAMIADAENEDVANVSAINADQSNTETILYQLKLDQNAYVDYMLDGKNTYKLESDKSIDGVYESGTVISVIKDFENYYFLVQGTMNNAHKRVNIDEKKLIEKGRFAIGLSSNSAEERYSADATFKSIDQTLMNSNGVYFTYLYTNSISGDEVLEVLHKKMTQ